MTEIQLVGIVTIATGILIMLMSIPLILRKIPMNSLYGVRFPQSFKSDQNWYDINQAGGKILAGWSMLLVLVGISGFFLPEKYNHLYMWSTAAATLITIIGMSIHAYIVARKIDQRNSNTQVTH